MGDALLDLSRQLGDRYLIERELGRGGMGAVYLARDRRLDRPVALKVLPSEFAIVPELRERFLRETRLAAGFSHPNIVPVFAIEETSEVLAFAMGFVEGESLASRVARDGPLSRRDTVRLLQDVGYALAYAHGRGVVHRDIKPDNVMIERATGRALVMDFGIARAITPVADKPGLTRVGEVVGTPEYMSPEQAAGEAVDGRADLYSLGLVAWFAVTGRTAVTGESTQRILVKQLTETIPPLATERADLPASLCDVVDRCCAKEADDRFPSAEAMVDALDATQLISPEIPVAIRLLAPHLTMIATRAIITLVLVAYGTYRITRFGNASIFSFGLIAAATLWVAALAGVQEIRRLRRAGFTVEELQRLLVAVQAERDEARAARAADPVLVKRRRTRVIAAWGILAWQSISIYLLLRDRIKDGDATLDGRAPLTVFFAGVIAIALSGTIVLSSPFRRSVGERLFVGVWLGPFGRALLQAVQGASKAGGTAAGPPRQTPSTTPPRPRTMAPQIPTTPATPVLDALSAEVSSLSARVSALESRTR